MGEQVSMNFSGSNRDLLSHGADVCPELGVAAALLPGAMCTMGSQTLVVVVAVVSSRVAPHLACTRTPAFVFDRCGDRGSGCTRSGCSGPNEREKTTSRFRFRLQKGMGNYASPRSWSSLPTGIVTTPGESLCVGTFLLNSGCMSFDRGTKLRPGTGKPEKPDVSAVLRQGVGARNKAIPASGYYVAGEQITGRLSFVSSAERGRF